MFDFLKSVIGIGKPAGIPATEADNATVREIVTDLKRLETVSPQLAQRAIAYVLTGEGSSVLLQLEQQANAVQNALGHYHYMTPTTAAQTAAQTAIKARNNVLGRRYGPEATWIRRYFEVLTLPHKGGRWGMFSHQGPSPSWLRGFFAQGELGLQTTLATDLNTILSWRDAEDSATVFALDLLVLEKVNQYYFRGHDIGSKFDFKAGLLAEKQAVIEAFAKYDRPGQAIFIHILKQFDLVKDEYFHFIYQQYLLTTSKAVREAAQNALLASPPETLAASATQTLADGNPTARAQAAQILPLVMGERARPLLENHLANETSKTVRKVIELGLGSGFVSDDAAKTARTLKGDGAEGYLAADGTEVLSPPLAALPGPTPLTDSVKAGYYGLLDQVNARQVKYYEQQKARYEQATADQRKAWWKSTAPTPPTPFDRSIAERYCALLASDLPINEAAVDKVGNVSLFNSYQSEVAADPPFNNPDLTLWHLCRARAAEECVSNNPHWFLANLLNGHGGRPRRHSCATCQRRRSAHRDGVDAEEPGPQGTGDARAERRHLRRPVCGGDLARSRSSIRGA